MSYIVDIACGSNTLTHDDYLEFLKYAFERCDRFMLVYVNFYNKGYSANVKKIMQELSPYEIYRRTDPKWAGTVVFQSDTNSAAAKATRYKIVFYRTEKPAYEILSKVEDLFKFIYPNNPQDLGFFIGNKCWFYSVAHEKIASVICANEEDVNKLRDMELSTDENTHKLNDRGIEAYGKFDESYKGV